MISETGIDPAEIGAVSTTCMREGIVLYDKDGNEIWACANVDDRANDEVAELIHSYPPGKGTLSGIRPVLCTGRPSKASLGKEQAAGNL